MVSRSVIHDIVIPVVSKILSEQGYIAPYERSIIRDVHLEEFFEEEMRRHFGVIGSNGCQHLREQLEEGKKNDPYAFEHLVRRLLNKYIKLAAQVKYSKKFRQPEKGPPDRFSGLRKEYPIRRF